MLYFSAYGDATRLNRDHIVVLHGASTSKTHHPAHIITTTYTSQGPSVDSAGARVPPAVDLARPVGPVTGDGRRGSRCWTVRRSPWHWCVRLPRSARLPPPRTRRGTTV